MTASSVNKVTRCPGSGEPWDGEILTPSPGWTCMQRGIVADFSHTSIPSVPSYTLGLAQIEEIQDALLELRRVKHEKFGQQGWRTVAWTDTFTSQGQYLLASGES